MHPNALIDLCAELLAQVLRLDHPADAVVSRFFKLHRGLGPRERATLAETTYSVLRFKRLYEHLALDGSGSRERRLAVLALAAPADFVQSALAPHERDWLAACRARQRSDLPEALRHNLPDWLAQQLQSEVGGQFWPLVDALNQTAGLDLRVNTLKARRDEVAGRLQTAGIASTPTPYSPWGLRLKGKPALQRTPVFVEGAVEVQDEGSQLLALLTDAHRGEMVVDFCAGAGGKTLALGAAMRSTGRLYAFDTSAHRLDALKPRLARSGLSNVHPVALAHERDERVKRLSGKIDRVLVDAPCSGLGTLRRNPDLKWRQSPQALAELALKQSAILQSAARLLKPGGRLVYATCSLLRQENEAVADAFAAANPDWTPLPAAQLLESLKVPQAAELCTRDDPAPGLYLRLWPHRHATDAFFAAVWHRG